MCTHIYIKAHVIWSLLILQYTHTVHSLNSQPSVTAASILPFLTLPHKHTHTRHTISTYLYKYTHSHYAHAYRVYTHTHSQHGLSAPSTCHSFTHLFSPSPPSLFSDRVLGQGNRAWCIWTISYAHRHLWTFTVGQTVCQGRMCHPCILSCFKVRTGNASTTLSTRRVRFILLHLPRAQNANEFLLPHAGWQLTTKRVLIAFCQRRTRSGPNLSQISSACQTVLWGEEEALGGKSR